MKSEILIGVGSFMLCHSILYWLADNNIFTSILEISIHGIIDIVWMYFFRSSGLKVLPQWIVVLLIVLYRLTDIITRSISALIGTLLIEAIIFEHKIKKKDL